MLLNLFGENDLNIYIFNRMGIVMGVAIMTYLAVYFYLQLSSMRLGHHDTFSSIVVNLDTEKKEVDHLSQNGNFLQFYELKFEDVKLMK